MFQQLEPVQHLVISRQRLDFAFGDFDSLSTLEPRVTHGPEGTRSVEVLAIDAFVECFQACRHIPVGAQHVASEGLQPGAGLLRLRVLDVVEHSHGLPELALGHGGLAKRHQEVAPEIQVLKLVHALPAPEHDVGALLPLLILGIGDAEFEDQLQVVRILPQLILPPLGCVREARPRTFFDPQQHVLQLLYELLLGDLRLICGQVGVLRALRIAAALPQLRHRSQGVTPRPPPRPQAALPRGDGGGRPMAGA
mmetsp:Transcript_101321/g.316729  ORF Transcript_101321/g.316729 Transcript_101321/m.316729 type:complete len:252 (+) Transcript_101321:348-1103(+)